LQALTKWFNTIADTFYRCFIENGYWKWLVDGFKQSIIITVFAVLLGFLFGIILATVRCSYDKNEESLKLRKGFGYYLLRFFNGLCKLYITVVRGVPVVVQLMIWYFVILVSQNNSTIVAIIAFGCNSAAYVAEIFRGGIMSVDAGQFEAGRSLGFNYVQTMVHIIIPQAIKTVLPTLLNEVIALLKETSVAGYIAVRDMTMAANSIKTRVFNIVPLVVVAIVYLIIVIGLTQVQKSIERRLARSDRN